MRKLKAVILSAVFFAAAASCFAQMAVIDAGVATILQATKADKAIYYAQSLAQMGENAQNTYNQFQNLLRAEQRALDNLKRAADVKSFDDFMKWQNRQLYMEREAEYRFNNMGIKIGDRTYHIQEVKQIPDAMRETYVDYWDNDFSEAQRRKMWTQLGLTPSNYVYLKTWQAREKAIADKLIELGDIKNDENIEAARRDKEIADKYAGDKNKPESEKIGEKEIAMNTHLTLMAMARSLRELSQDLSEAEAMRIAQRMMEETPPSPPQLSDHWNARPFGTITEN